MGPTDTTPQAPAAAAGEVRLDAEAAALRPDLDGHLLGAYTTGRPGPLVLLVGGIHGNEPAGVYAIRQVLRRLEQEALPLRGRLVGLAGNLEALRRGERFVERDLNRMWGAEEIARVRAARARPDDDEGPDERARRDLLAAIETEIAAHRTGPSVLLDLHSTSASGAPFCVIGDTMQNRRIALAMPVPVILGLEEAVDGALLELFGERGHVAVGFEAGEHGDPRTVGNGEAAIWLALRAAGALGEDDVTALAAEMHARLAQLARGLPSVVEIRHRHALAPGDEFCMTAGFANFDRVRAGDVLATDRDGPVRASLGGRVLLPLYQGLGGDGFFLGRDVRRFWLHVSAWLRHLHVERIVHFLPGVERHPRREGTFVVDPRIARVFSVELFHLLGYRRARPEGERLVFSRRRESPRSR